MRRIAIQSIAQALLTATLLFQGIAAPSGFSSLAVLLMIVALPLLGMVLFFRWCSAEELCFLRGNLALAGVFAFYTLLALFYGGLAYPSYVVSILIYQCFFAITLLVVGAEGVWRAFRAAALVNVCFVALQMLGGMLGSKVLVDLRFLAVMKGMIEYWGFAPRASGLMTEPAHLSYLLLPPLLVSLIAPRKLGWMRRGRFALLPAYVLTFSLVAYIQLGIAITISSLRRASVKSLATILCALVLLGALYELIPFARDRVEGLLALREDSQTSQSSVFALQSNALVTMSSLQTAPLFGQGLTSHRKSYDRLIGSLFDYTFDDTWQDLNKNDAGSLILLLLSETGLLGLLLFFGFVGYCTYRFAREHGQIAVVGLAHTLTLAVVGFRYGQLASAHFMLNLQVVLYCLAFFGFRGARSEEAAQS